MKKLTALSLLFLLVSSSNALAAVVGKVDIQHILLTIDEGKKVRDQLQKEFDKKQASLKTEEDKIRKAQEDFKKQASVMSDSARLAKEQEIQNMIMKIQETSQTYQSEIQNKERDLKKPILDRLKVVIEDVSKSENVDMTFEISTAPIVYAKEEKDLSKKVIDAYNKKHK